MAERILPYPYTQAGLLLPESADIRVEDGIFIGHGVMPTLLVANLIDLSEDLGVRRQGYAWTDASQLPSPVREAATFFHDVFE